MSTGIDVSIDWAERDNCTHFVSETLAAGGLPQQGTWPIDREGWNHRPFPRAPMVLPVGPVPVILPGVGFGAYGHAWGGADAQHDLFTAHGSPEVPQGEEEPGDALYWHERDPESAVHHAAVVSRVLPNGDVLYTQHTDPGRDQSLSGREPISSVDRGDQDVRAVRVRRAW